MTKREEYKFRIDAFKPDTIPMSRLAEYMADVATLLGTQEHVHFLRLEDGSTVLVQEVEYEAVPKVRERLEGIRTRSAPDDALKAFSDIDQKLSEDNASGLLETEMTRVIEFPGRNRSKTEVFGPVVQPGTIDGVLIRVGGRDATVPVYLLEGEIIHKCNSNREVAKRLAPHLFGGTLRVHGFGKWNRDSFGNWVMERFNITDFTPLDDSNLSVAVAKMRSITTDLHSSDDPLKELGRLRHGTGETN